MGKSDFPYLKELLLLKGKKGSKFFPLSEVPILKKDIIVEDRFSAFWLRHCYIQ